MLQPSEPDLKLLKSCFENTDENKLKNVLNNSNLFEKIQENPFDSIGFIYDILKSDNEYNINILLKKILEKISENSDPKVILCILNDYISRTDNDYKYAMLLFPLSSAIRNLQLNHRASYLNLNESLECSLSYFSKLTTAHYSGLEGKELDVYIQTGETQRFYQISQNYIDFLRPIFDNKKFMSDSIFNSTMLNHILKLYKVSLIKLGFYSNRVVAEDCKKCTLRAFELIENNTNCCHKLLLELMADEAGLWESISCLLFHIFIDEKMAKYPRIYSDEYNLNFASQALWQCLNYSQDSHVIRICIAILEKFSKSDDFKVKKILYKSNLHPNLFKALSVSMTSNFTKEIRGRLFSLFTSLFNSLESEGRYEILLQMLKLITHSGAKGQLILLLKNEILIAISNTAKYDFGGCGNETKESKHHRLLFTGSSVYRILSDIFVLPDGNETDIINESDWLLAALNFLFVVHRRDRQHKLIGLDVLLDDIRAEFLNQLTECIELARVLYEKERNGLEKAMSKENEDESYESMCDVMLGPAASFMGKDEKRAFIEKALLTLDMMSSGIARVNSL